MKHFLGKNEALSLATTIANVQEKKIQSKRDKKHNSQAAQPQQVPKTASRTKFKLKETKGILVARRMEAKRNRARSRKQRLQGSNEDQQGSREGKLENPARKKVSFL